MLSRLNPPTREAVSDSFLIPVEIMTQFQTGIGVSATEMLKNLTRTRRAMSLLYGFAVGFIAFTAFLAFFNPTATTPSTRSHFPSVFSYYFFPNSTTTQLQRQNTNTSATETQRESETPHSLNPSKNLTNQSQSHVVAVAEPPTPTPTNTSSESKAKVGISVIDKGMRSKANYTISQLRKQPHITTTTTTTTTTTRSSEVGNATASDATKKQLSVEEELAHCHFYDGSWLRDESYPLYQPGSCSLIDEQFNCILNGRPDTDFHKLRWKPHGCTLPRLDAKRMLQMLKGKRLAFVGDSLNRNMWESLVCILKSVVKDQKKVYEAHGRHRFRTAEASYSFIFKDYNLAVEFFVSPYLVREWDIREKNGHKKETLRLDLMGESAVKYKEADILIFNTGHWWTHEKTSKGEDYYQEGKHVYDKLHVKEAYRKAINTWAKWVDNNVNPSKTMVFFRGYSESHFSGGRWNSGGHCHNETEPITNVKFLAKYPYKMRALETVLHGMKTPVSYLNITRITDFRKDGHPSIYRKQKYSKEERQSPLRYQDCSHWCLPGVPDTWNELLYAELLVKEYQRRTQHS